MHSAHDLNEKKKLTEHNDRYHISANIKNGRSINIIRIDNSNDISKQTMHIALSHIQKRKGQINVFRANPKELEVG